MKSRPSFPDLTAAALVLFAVGSIHAQATGTAHPEAVEDNVTPVARHSKPSPAIPANATVHADSAQSEDHSSHYVPPAAHAAQARTAAATEETPTLHTHAAATPRAAADVEQDESTKDTFEVTDDVNSGVVTDVPVRPGELGSGSLLRARLETRLSTEDSRVGTVFTARLEQPVQRGGEVLLPAGTILHGRVADVHGGSRLRGGALLRLQPDSVSLPDGTIRSLAADLIDLGTDADRNHDQRVDSEGAIHQRSHPVRDLSAAGLATGTGAVAGALIGGGVGAVVGAGIGAGVSTVVWLRHDQQEVLPAGTMLVFSLNEPLTIRASLQ